MEKAWNFIWNRLFDERTCPFYNYLVGDEPDAAVKKCIFLSAKGTSQLS